VNSYQNKITSLFNQFDGRNLDLLDQFYASNIQFEDPLTKVSGLHKLKDYFFAAYKNVSSIRFDFYEINQSGDKYTGLWTMHLKVPGLNGGKEYQVQGVSILHFDDKGLICYHRDFLDLGDMVYERLPVIGKMIKLLKKKLSHS
jgi:hypothetical protein